jgi:hypothetical protein
LLGVLLSVLIPVEIGIRDILSVIFVALICVVPAIVLAYIVVFRLIPPRYEEGQQLLTLLDR